MGPDPRTAGTRLVKRLHVVGKSKDNKRLYLAQSRDAKSGSFEVSISRKLLGMVEEARNPAGGNRRAPAAAYDDVAGVRVLPMDPKPDESSPSSDGPTFLRAADDIDLPIGIGDAAEAPEADDPGDADALRVSAPAPEPEAPRRAPIQPRREKPEIPARSKLSPAEIQGLIRAGRGVRSVANLAGTPVAWVRYLAEPIQQERQAIVAQMLTARQERSRLGPSGVGVGEAIVQNLRSRGVRSPEAALEEGFIATRPNGREWRVQFIFDHRGRRQRATWSYDPQARRVTPLDTLATQLGWRRPPDLETEDGARPARRRRAATVTSGGSRKSSSRKTATRKTSSARKSAARSSARKRTTAKRTAKTSAARRRSSGRTTTRSAKTSSRTSTSRRR